MALPPFKQPSEQRSRNMRAIRSSRNSTTEKRLAALLRQWQIRGWQSHSRDVVGKPDFLNRHGRVAVFADGCFFHGCPLCGHIPATNRAYWTEKIERNKSRDLRISRTLRRLGYRVVRIRECQLRTKPTWCVDRIVRALQSPKLAARRR